jgi:lipoprotein-anchoring transpeptidase ErfK/SrfK
MTRIFAFLIAAFFILAAGGYAQAQGYGQGYNRGYNQGSGLDFNQGFDPGFGQGYNQRPNRGFGSPDIMRGDSDYYGTAASPIPRTLVRFDSGYPAGTIVVNTAERRLYLVLGDGEALRYGIGVGRDGFRWGGVHRVSAKKEWPGWTPPADMLRRRPDLPRHMAGGIDNPLGARAIYLGSTLYRIHGSNEPETIGQAVSSGCFRMTNQDVVDLYDRVHVGATVVVKN